MKPIIFTNGAYLQPMKVKNENDKEYWIWAVSEFVDDSFNNGEVFNPNETAENLEILLTE